MLLNMHETLRHLNLRTSPRLQQHDVTELTNWQNWWSVQRWSSTVDAADRGSQAPKPFARSRRLRRVRLSTSCTAGEPARTPVVGGSRMTVGNRGWFLATPAMPVPVCLSGPCQSSSRVVSLASSPPPRPVLRASRSHPRYSDRQRWDFPFSRCPRFAFLHFPPATYMPLLSFHVLLFSIRNLSCIIWWKSSLNL